MKKIKAFTTEEVTVSLSLIAVLLLLMIFLHNISGNNSKVALDKFSQLDSALNKWYYQTKNIDATIKDTDTLTVSLKEFIAKKSKIQTFKIVVNKKENYNEINLNNGMILQVKYVKNKNRENKFEKPIFNNNKYNMNEENLAVITSKVTSGHQTFTEEYVLKQSYIISLSKLYNNWERYPIETISAKDGKQIKIYCDTQIKNQKYNKEEICSRTNSEGTFIYTKMLTTLPCRNGHTGNIEMQLIGSVEGVSELPVDKCCAKPQEYIGGIKKCECPKNIDLTPGYFYNKDSLTCQTPCLSGTYLKKGKCISCPLNYYCSDIAMTKPIKCPDNSYTKKEGAVSKEECISDNK